MTPINIKDQLPIAGERILVFVPQENKWFIDEMRILSKSDGGKVELTHWYIHNVTHWMELPEPIN